MIKKTTKSKPKAKVKRIDTREAISSVELEIRKLEIRKQCEPSPYKRFQLQQQINKRSRLLSEMRSLMGGNTETADRRVN